MFRYLFTALVLVGILSASRAAAQGVEFSYDGRVRSGGVPFDGNGLFKFAIVSNNSTNCFWSNDGVTLTGNEPTTSVQIAVSNGFFSVIIGDTSIAGMASLDSAIFNTNQRVKLRVWFSDGVNGFQQLTPDRPITNPQLIGLQDPESVTIYVDPVEGNDNFPGNQADQPKKTILAAWNALPATIKTTATIQLAAGVYYGSPTLSGKVVANNAQIVLRGDLVNTDSVRISGAADQSTSNTAANSFALSIKRQQGLMFEGICFERGLHFGLCVGPISSVHLYRCTFKENTEIGLQLTGNSVALLDNIYTEHTPGAIAAEACSSMVLNNSMLHQGNRQGVGVSCTNTSMIDMSGTTVSGFYTGTVSYMCGALNFRATNLSWGGFDTITLGGGNTIDNCNIGVEAHMNASVIGAIPGGGYNGTDAVTYTNVTTPRSAFLGGVIN